jgi:hypothetical protein
MSTNLFAPPRAPTPYIDGAGPVRVAKPVSAWLLQFACAIGITALNAVIALSIKAMLLSDHVRWLASATHLAIDGVFMVWLVAAFVGIQRRARYGRPLGLTVIGALFLLSAGLLVIVLTREARIGVSGAYLLGECVGGALVPLLCAGWWRAFGHSKAARTWFDVGRMPGRS